MAKKAKKTLFEALEPILIVVVFGLVVGLGYYYILDGELKKLLPGGELHKASEEQKLAEDKEYLGRLQALNNLYQQSQDTSSSNLGKVLPSEGQIPELFVTFETLTRNRGLGLQSIDIVTDRKTKGAKAGVKEVLVGLKISDVDYRDLKNIIADFEKHVRVLDVESMSYDPKSRFMDINVKTYYHGKTSK